MTFAMNLQQMLRDRQSDEFVGRIDVLTSFRRDLDNSTDPRDRRYVYAISGQAGVGKTHLLQRLRVLSESLGAATGLSDERDTDIPVVLNRLAKQLSTSGFRFDAFKERHKTYLVKRQELEASPDAPDGLSGLLGQTLVKGGLRLAATVPVAGALVDLVDPDAAGRYLGDLTSYVYKRITSKDDVQLLLEPVDVLTPLFLADLNRSAQSSRVVVFFDTYERTSSFLDEWLRQFIHGSFGEVTSNLTLVVAGQSALNDNHWAPYEPLLSRWQLNAFTSQETKTYLAKRNIINQTIVDDVFKLSGGLPILVATLGSAGTDGRRDVGTVTDTAVRRFLKWVDDPLLRRAATIAAIPRRFDKDIIDLLYPAAGDSIFGWLKTRPFSAATDSGYRYHDVVRTHLIAQVRLEEPQLFASLHASLRDHYAISARQGQFKCDLLYHTLCSAPLVDIGDQIGLVLEAACLFRSDTKLLAAAVEQAALDTSTQALEEQAALLSAAVDALLSRNTDAALQSAIPMADRADIPIRIRAGLLSTVGGFAADESRHIEAEGLFTRSLALRPEDPPAWLRLGSTQLALRKWVEAVRSCTRALEIDPTNGRAFLLRGRAHAKLGESDAAILDWTRAAELTENLRHSSYKRIALEQARKSRYRESVSAFKQSLSCHRACPDCWHGVARSLLQLYPEGPLDLLLDGILEIPEDDADAIAAKLGALATHRPEQALARLNAAIVRFPSHSMLFARRGIARGLTDDWAGGISDLTAALQTATRPAWLLRQRSHLHSLATDYRAAANDLEAAMKVDRSRGHLDLSRIGDLLVSLGEHQEAADAFRRALSLDAACPHCWTGLVGSYVRMGLTDQIGDIIWETDFPGWPPVLVASCKIAGFLNNSQERIGVHYARLLAEQSEAGRHEAVSRLREAGLLQVALELIEASGPIDSWPDHLVVLAGLILAMQRRFGEAIARFTTLPESLAMRYNIAVAAVLRNDPTRGSIEMALLDDFIAGRDDLPAADLAYVRAGIAMVSGRIDDGVAALKYAATLDSQAVKTAFRDPAWMDHLLVPSVRSLFESHGIKLSGSAIQ